MEFVADVSFLGKCFNSGSEEAEVFDVVSDVMMDLNVRV